MGRRFAQGRACGQAGTRRDWPAVKAEQDKEGIPPDLISDGRQKLYSFLIADIPKPTRFSF